MDISAITTRSLANRSRLGVDGGNNASMNLTAANFDLFIDENAAVKVSETLFEDFPSALTESQGSSKVFTLIGNFEQLCEDMSAILSKIVERASGSDLHMEQTMAVMQQVKSERFAWRLLRQLYEDRIDRQPQEMLDGVDIQSDCAPDDHSVYSLLLKTDRQFRELTLILKWCEEVAAEQLNDANTLAAFASKLVLWQNTLHNRKRGAGGCDMDPDGPLRTGQSLDSYDENDDVKLISVIFSYVRCGQIQKAIDLCVHCGQSWRASVLQGKLLASDPNLGNNNTSDLFKTSGNRRRPLWKSACWNASENASLSLVERSLLAALSGRLGPLLTVCRQWDDRLWAYVTASVEFQLSTVLHRLGRSTSPSDVTGIDLADFTLESIHQELSASDEGDIDAYHQICKFLMLDDPNNAVAFMYEWLADRSDAPPLHVLRFMTHVILVFQRLQINIPPALGECIIELYVKQLISMKQSNAIALYAAQLPVDKAVHLFVQYMEGINDAARRRETLKQADAVGFDTLQLCRMVVDRIRSVCVVVPSDDDQSSVFETQSAPEQETRLIEALDWLTLDARLSADAVRQSNAIVRAFLVADKAEKAREALSRVDADAVEVARMVWERENGAAPLPLALDVDCKEHLCLRSYLEAHDSFDRWFACAHRARPSTPEGSMTTTAAAAASRRPQSFTERAEAELVAKRHETELQRWQHSCHIYAEAAVRSLENVLLFPDGGWLIDRHHLEDDEDDDRRQSERRAELQLLRRRCLSRAAFMLATVLSESGRIREALRLADVIASEKHALHSAIDPAELRKLLRLLADCATRALEHGHDATGVAAMAHRE